MDYTLFWTIIGTGVGIVGFLYALLRNIKIDFDHKLDKLDEKLTSRIDGLGGKIANMNDRLIEVEKHLFAIRTMLNYDPDNFMKEK